MGQIYFHEHIVQEILKEVHEAHDLKDVGDDLDAVINAKNGIYGFNGLQKAAEVDSKIRKKYKVDEMVELANRLSVRRIGYMTYNEPQIDEQTKMLICLDQDYHGIIYDTALKKLFIKSFEDIVMKVV